MSNNSTPKRRSRTADRPKKPYPTFPLTPHASGAWQKKIRGKIHYFGKWAKRVNGKLERIEGDGWQEALEQYKAVADDLHAGRTPRVQDADGLTVADLCNRFLTAKLRQQTSGELGPRMFQEYRETCDTLVAAFGQTRLVEDLAADDFEALRATMAERWGPTRLGNGITRVKSVFKYGLDNALMERPVRYGSEFVKPAKAVMRRHRAKNGKKFLEAGQVRQLLDAANPILRAMIYLGCNCGFGNHDVASLPQSAIDFETGWVDFARAKTGIERRCWLWPETIAAVKEALTIRPEPRDPADADLIFLVSSGRRWVRNTPKSHRDNVSLYFGKLLKKLGMHRDGLNFYSLRHCFRTVADAAHDTPAIDRIMGHTDPSMGGHYRERIEDSRLRAIAEHVRAWLFDETPDDGTTAPDSKSLQISDLGVPSDLPQRDEGDARPTLRLFAG
jgi:integrase